jgi:PadR family transcriptional regulator AphA
MSLPHAILGMLSGLPMTGYDLSQVFDRTSGFFWPASQAQIYPELRKLERQGLLSAKTVKNGGRTKRIYSVTGEGLGELGRWLREVPPYGPDRDRDSEKLRTMYLDMVPSEVARQFFEQHANYYRQRLEQYRARLDRLLKRQAPLVRSRLANRPVEEHERIIAFKEFALDGQIETAEQEIAWAQRGIALTNRLDARNKRRRNVSGR